MKIKDKNSLLYWYPKVKDLVKTPKTEIVSLKRKSTGEGGIPVIWDEKEVERAIEKVGGYPIFIRTDQASNKHSMARASWVRNEEELNQHISEVIFFNETCSLLGLPYTCLVIREWLDLEYKITAFEETKIAKELRFFIRDGKVLCHHYYWPKEAIEQSYRHNQRAENVDLLENDEEVSFEKLMENKEKALTLPKDIESKWLKTKEETLEEVELVKPKVRKIAKKFNNLKGSSFWSVDFAKTEAGDWYLIDMAEGEKSWHPQCDAVEDKYINEK